MLCVEIWRFKMLCNKCGKEMDGTVQLCSKCDKISRNSGRLAIQKQGDFFGLVDTDNSEYILNPICLSITQNRQNEFLYDARIGNEIYRIRDFYERHTISFYDSNDEHLYMMKNGKVIGFPLEIVNGYGLIKMNGLYGIVDDSYRLICPLNFERGMSFGDKKHFISLDGKTGMVSFSDKKEIYFMKSKEYFTYKVIDELWGIDSVNPITEYWYYDKERELIIVPFMNGCTIKRGVRRYYQDGKYGLITEDGRKIINNTYDEIIPNEENLSKYRIDKMFGYIDCNGRKIEKRNSGWYYQQYQRVCNQCGHVWFTTIGDEKKLKSSLLDAFFGGLTESGRIKYKVNEILNERELEKLHSCPSCGSKSYSEEII